MNKNLAPLEMYFDSQILTPRYWPALHTPAGER